VPEETEWERQHRKERVFSVENSSLWVDRWDNIHQGICSGMSAVWIQKTVAKRALLTSKSELIDGQTIDSLQRFYRSVAGVHSTFRHDHTDHEWSAAGKLFKRLALTVDPESSNDMFKENLRWAVTKKGLFFIDVKGQSQGSFIWHTMGLYFGDGAAKMQLFDPNVGLYEFGGVADGLRALITYLNEYAPGYPQYASSCYRIPFAPAR
jgi:hypothetical protein